MFTMTICVSDSLGSRPTDTRVTTTTTTTNETREERMNISPATMIRAPSSLEILSHTAAWKREMEEQQQQQQQMQMLIRNGQDPQDQERDDCCVGLPVEDSAAIRPGETSTHPPVRRVSDESDAESSLSSTAGSVSKASSVLGAAPSRVMEALGTFGTQPPSPNAIGSNRNVTKAWQLEDHRSPRFFPHMAMPRVLSEASTFDMLDQNSSHIKNGTTAPATMPLYHQGNGMSQNKVISHVSFSELAPGHHHQQHHQPLLRAQLIQPSLNAAPIYPQWRSVACTSEKQSSPPPLPLPSSLSSSPSTEKNTLSKGLGESASTRSSRTVRYPMGMLVGHSYHPAAAAVTATDDDDRNDRGQIPWQLQQQQQQMHTLWNENQLLRRDLQSKEEQIVALQKQIDSLSRRMDDYREMPMRKISQIPIQDMLDLMCEYGSEISEGVTPPRMSNHIQKASVIRQFRRWNPNFFDYFERKNGIWVPKLGKERELLRRAKVRRERAQAQMMNGTGSGGNSASAAAAESITMILYEEPDDFFEEEDVIKNVVAGNHVPTTTATSKSKGKKKRTLSTKSSTTKKRKTY